MNDDQFWVIDVCTDVNTIYPMLCTVKRTTRSCRCFSKPDQIRLLQFPPSTIFDQAATYCRSTRSFRLMEALLSYFATKLLCVCYLLLFSNVIHGIVIINCIERV